MGDSFPGELPQLGALGHTSHNLATLFGVATRLL